VVGLRFFFSLGVTVKEAAASCHGIEDSDSSP